MSGHTEEPDETDVAGRGEEDFEAGMRQNAIDYSEADTNQDRRLDFEEFSAFIRSREEGEHTEEELRARFASLDTSNDSGIDMKEFMAWSLREALARSSQRVVDLFRQWDEDHSMTVDRREFWRAVRALGFDVTQAETDYVFDSLDKDHSGKIEYKELNTMLRQSAGSEATKRNLSRVEQADRSRSSRLSAKNINVNYKVARTSVLPMAVKLETDSEVSVQEQLVEILKQNSIKLIDLFREWDEDGNGGLDKKELRKAVAALGFEAPKAEVDALFDTINDDGNGFIEFEEFKRALSERSAKAATKAKVASLRKQKSKGPTDSEMDAAAAKMQAIQRGRQARKSSEGPPADAPAAPTADATDVAGTGEEEFDVGMRQNWIDFDLSDVNQDMRLSYDEFASWVRSREEGKHTDEELQARFASMDIDTNGKIDPHEYLQWSLRDALLRSSGRVVDLFRQWDSDHSGFVDKKEFFRAIRSLGYDMPQADVDAVFDTLDADSSGQLEYKELNTMLRQSQGADATARHLKRVKQADRSRGAKLTKLNNDTAYVGPRVACLPETVQLESTRDVTVQEQLFKVLKSHSVRLIDLFREWDDDANGALDKKELRKGLAALGFEAPKKDVDALFDSFDKDGGGLIEYEEFKKVLSEKGVKQAQEAADEAARKAGLETPSERRRKAEQALREQAEEEAAAAEAAEAAAGRQGAPLSAAAKTTQQHLCSFLGANNARMMALFRDWDNDANGALDRREFHRAIGCLGYYCEKKEIDSLFDLIDESGDGNIDFGEMKRALNAWSSGRLTASPRQLSRPSSGAPPALTKRSSSFKMTEALDAAESVLMGLPEGENPGALEMEAHGEHTHTVVLLHAEGSAAEAYSRLYRRFGEISVHCKFVFPRAPKRPIAEPGQVHPEVSCWLAPKEATPPSPGQLDMPGDDVDSSDPTGTGSPAAEQAMVAQLGAQTRRLHALLDREVATLGGDASRVVLGGASQGGMLALHAAMSYKAPLGALLCLRTMLSAEYTSVLGGEHARTPVFVFAGGRDTICPLHQQQASFQRMSDAGYKVEWHVEPDLTHHADSLNEQRYVAYWVARASMTAGTKHSFGGAAVQALYLSLIKRKTPAPISPHSPQPPASRRPGTARGRRGGSLRFNRGRSASPDGRARSASPSRVQMLGPPSPGLGPPSPGSPRLQIGPDGQLVRVHPLQLEPSWRLPSPPPSNTKRPPRPEWNDRCCLAGDGGLQVAVSHKLEQLVAEEKQLEAKRIASFEHAQRQYSRPHSARSPIGRVGSGFDRAPSPPRPGSSPQHAEPQRGQAGWRRQGRAAQQPLSGDIGE